MTKSTGNTHIMFDLETLATTPDAVISQIGAVEFSPDTGKIGEKFAVYVNIDQKNRRIDPDTVRWWMRQSDAARSTFYENDNDHDLRVALALFADWAQPKNAACIWSHGLGFDVPILKHALHNEIGAAPWWDFRGERDTRTLFATVTDMTGEPFVIKRTGTFHNAADDARAQAEAVCAAYARLTAHCFVSGFVS